MWVWIFIAIAAAIGEVLTVDLFLASVAVAAVAAAIASVLFIPLVIQIVLFAVLSLVGIGVVRPAVKHALGIDATLPPDVQVRHAHVVGRQAVVIQAVDAHAGQIRIGQGEFWTARAFDPQESIPVGTRVEVLMVEGITALVAPVTPAAQLESTLAEQKGS
jgi:membrane protein implicated in regulation of membrane protease activity